MAVCTIGVCMYVYVYLCMGISITVICEHASVHVCTMVCIYDAFMHVWLEGSMYACMRYVCSACCSYLVATAKKSGSR